MTVGTDAPREVPTAMLRTVLLATLLLAGPARAQLFLSPETTATLVPQLNFSSPDATATPDPDLPGAEVATLDPAAYGDSVVFDGATVAQIEALLAEAGARATAADRENALVARVATGEDGATLLTLDVADADGVPGAEPADLALGECNEGTTWVRAEVNCHNAYPAAGR